MWSCPPKVITVDPTFKAIYLINYAILLQSEKDCFVEEVGSHFPDGMNGWWSRGMCYEHLQLSRYISIPIVAYTLLETS